MCEWPNLASAGVVESFLGTFCTHGCGPFFGAELTRGCSLGLGPLQNPLDLGKVEASKTGLVATILLDTNTEKENHRGAWVLWKIPFRVMR